MLQKTYNKALSTQATENKKNQEVLNITTKTKSDGVGGSIKNLLTIINLAKSKKPKLIKSKKSDLSNVKANFGTDFLISRAKKPLYTYKNFYQGSNS